MLMAVWGGREMQRENVSRRTSDANDDGTMVPKSLPKDIIEVVGERQSKVRAVVV